MKEKIFALTFLVAALAATPVRAQDDFEADELSNAKLENEFEYTQADELMAQKIQAEEETKNLRADVKSEKNKLATVRHSNDRIRRQIESKMIALRSEQANLNEVKKQYQKESNQFDQQSSKLNGLKTKISSIREQKSQMRDMLAETKNKIREVKKEIRSLEREKKQSLAAISKWKAEHKRLERKKARHLGQAKKLSREVSQLQRKERRAKDLALNR